MHLSSEIRNESLTFKSNLKQNLMQNYDRAGAPECMGMWGLVPTNFIRYINPIKYGGGGADYAKGQLIPTKIFDIPAVM